MTDNVAGALCYLLGLITGILFLALAPYNQSKFVRFHAFQSIFFNVFWIALWIVEMILSAILHTILPFGAGLLFALLGLVIWLGGLLIWIFLLYKAYSNEKYMLPVIGALAGPPAHAVLDNVRRLLDEAGTADAVSVTSGDVRGNRFGIWVNSGSTAPVTIDSRSGQVLGVTDTGIFVSQSCRDVLTQGNTFANVTHELMDEPALRKAAQERLAKYLNRPDPVLVLNFEEAPGNVTPDASGNGFAARLEGGATLVPGGVSGQAMAFDGTGYLRVNEPAVFNAPDLTVDFWIKPATLKGRRGLIAKRFSNAGCPFVVNQTGASVGFEATDEQGKWSLNFGGPATLKENQWSRVTVVMKTGQGVRVFVDGKLVSEKQNPLGRQENMEPLIIGREAWGGDPPTTAGPGCFIGLMDQVRIWTRALTDAEIAAGK